MSEADFWIAVDGQQRALRRASTGRVADDGAADEVGLLTGTMNAMLERLDESTTRQREFIADVSHDLQSPLTGQRTVLELAIATPDATDVQTVSREALHTTTEMERLVGDLLVLASVDAGVEAQCLPFDLDELVLEEVTRARALSSIRIETHGVSAAPAYGVSGDIRRVVRNLLDNAIAHARSTVTLIAYVEDSRSVVDVIDNGPGIAPEDRERIFDRFYRSNSARARGGGSGLGLAIARSLAQRSGGTVVVLDSLDGARLCLTLPATGSTAGDEIERRQ